MDIQQPRNLIELLDYLKKKGIPESLHYRYIGPFLETKSRSLHIPVHGIFELTPLCNFSCRMCYVHLSSQQFSGRKLLPVEQWKQLADAARSAGMRTIALSGGECLTYPGFDDLYIHLVSSGLRVYVMTNGYYLDNRRLALFKDYKPSHIQISIYGSSEDAYEKVTGVRAFARVHENIINVRDAGLSLSLAITPSIHMRDDVETLIRLAESLHVKYGVNPQLMQPRNETGRSKEDISLDDYMSIYHLLSSIHHEDLKTVDWSEVPKENTEGPQRYGIRCGAGRSSFAINYDGTMSPCNSLDEIKAEPLKIGFDQAWQQISNAAEKYPIPFECGDCVYQKHCLSCVAVHNSAPVQGHCDPTVCARTRRLVQEGFIPLKNIC